MANWTILKEAIASVIKTNDNQEITGQLLQNALNNIITNVGENATFAGIATPTTNPGTPDGPVFYIATTAGSYSNFGSLEVSKGETAILQWNNGTWTKNAIKPMAEFESGIIYDVSANNDGAVFESLSTLLGSANLSTLIPTSVRRGGMSIQFIQSSNNKYVQYRLMANAWSTNVSNWQNMDTDRVHVSSIGYEYTPTFVQGKFIRVTDNSSYPKGYVQGGVSDNYLATEDYYPVYKGQTISINCVQSDSWAGSIAFYSEKNYNSCIDVVSFAESFPITGDDSCLLMTFEQDGYVRFGYNSSKLLSESIVIKTISPKVDAIETGNYLPVASHAVKYAKVVNIDHFYDDGITTGISIGDTIFNVNTKQLKYVYTSDIWKILTLDKETIYRFNQLEFYWNGTDLVLITKLINLFSLTNEYENVEKEGDVYLNRNGVLRICNVYDSSTPANSKFINFNFIGYEECLYIFEDGTYIFYDGELVPSIAKDIIQDFSLSFNSGYFLRGTESGGNPIGKYEHAGDLRFYADPNFYRVSKGQTIKTNLYSPHEWNCAMAFYSSADENSCEYVVKKNTPYNEWTHTFEKDGYVRFGHVVYYTPIYSVFIKTVVKEENLLFDFDFKTAFSRNEKNYVADEKGRYFTPSTQRVPYKYTGQVDAKKRYLAIGFDDFRDSDFSMVQPLFEKYEGAATFNMIISEGDIPKATEALKRKFQHTLFGNHEVGDHTFLHIQYNVNDPLFDGSTFPTNDQMRLERSAGGGRNVFAFLLTNPVSTDIPSISINTAWGSLSDAECQQIREKFAVISNSDVLHVYDTLSNRYLGTNGYSDDNDAWDGEKFVKGIFTGSHSSANHEIWERITACKMWYCREQFGMNFDFKTWCLPGNSRSNMFFYDTVSQRKYYDAAMTKLANDTAKFTSTINGRTRSLLDIWREFGYFGAHGNIWPSKQDGVHRVAMSENLFFNEKLSRNDALLYPTSLSIIDYLSPSVNYPASFFTTGKSRRSQMYDDETVQGRPFRTYIEYIRNITARHGIAGGVFDSVDDYSSRMFFESVLQYCKSAGIEVIPKATAYDICFNHNLENGNLIGNSDLENTAEKFFTDSEDMPTNPDGYIGNCYVDKDSNNIPILHTSGNVLYTLFGVPYGNLNYSAIVSGTGTIKIQAIPNNAESSVSGGIQTYSSGLIDLATITLSGASEQSISENLFIKDFDKGAYEQVCEGYGNKIMGLQFTYSSGLSIKNIRLIKE